MLFFRFAIYVVSIYHLLSALLQVAFPDFARYKVALGLNIFYIDFRVVVTLLLLLTSSRLVKIHKKVRPKYPFITVRVYLIFAMLMTAGFNWGSDVVKLHCQLFLFYLSLIVHVGYSNRGIMSTKILLIVCAPLLIFGNRFFILSHGLLFICLLSNFRLSFKNVSLILAFTATAFLVSISRFAYGGRITMLDLFSESEKSAYLIFESDLREVLLSDFVYRVDANAPLQEYARSNSFFNSPDLMPLYFSFKKAVPSVLFEKTQVNQLDEEDFYNSRINVNSENIDMTYGLVSAMIFTWGSFYLLILSIILCLLCLLIFVIKSPFFLGLLDIYLLLVFSTYELNFTGFFLLSFRFSIILLGTILIFAKYENGIKHK